MKKTLTLAPGAVIEPVGNDVMVMMPGNTDILRISGPAADTLRTIVAGQPVDPSTPTVLELADQGIIQTSWMSRRGLIRAGAIGAGAGIAVLAMPTAAAAASPAEVETRLATFNIPTTEQLTEGDPFNLSHQGPPPPRTIVPDPFPTTGTTGTYSVRGLVLAMVFDADGNDGAGMWSTVPAAGNDRDTLNTFIADKEAGNVPFADRGTLTWTFEGINFVANHFL